MTRRRAILAGSLVAGSVMLGLGALTLVKYLGDLRAAQARVSTGNRMAETPCGPIEYSTTGEGPPVLLVHGAGGGFDQGLDLGTYLVDQGFSVIAMSRFGYLNTPLPADASAAAQADAHACLLDWLNIPKAAVIGASAGAPSAMQFALRHPHRCLALALLVPATYAPGQRGAAPGPSALLQLAFDTVLRSDFLFWLAIRNMHETLLRTILGTPLEAIEEVPADERERIDLVLRHILPVSRRRQGLVNDMVVTSSLPRYELEGITCPTLAISAADDLFGTFQGASYTAQHIPEARFIGYQTGGHLLAGHHQEVQSEIAAFLAQNPGPDPNTTSNS